MKKMRTLVIAVMVVVTGFVSYNWFTTGRLTLIPSRGLSQNEYALKNLNDRMVDAKNQYSQAARTASISGIDTTADAETARIQIKNIQKELDALRKDLTEEAEIREADKLADALKEFATSLS